MKIALAVPVIWILIIAMIGRISDPLIQTDWNMVAAWVQGAGTFAAAAIALYIFNRQTKIAKEIRESERVARAEVLSAEIFWSVARMEERVDSLFSIFPEYNEMLDKARQALIDPGPFFEML